MSKLTKNKLYSIKEEINKDLESGVYQNFPLVYQQILKVRSKIDKAIHIVNFSLSTYDLQVLEYNGYLSEEIDY